jgi:hypothetical protein
MVATYNGDVVKITLHHEVVAETILGETVAQVFPTPAEAEAFWNSAVARVEAEHAEFVATYVEPKETSYIDWMIDVLGRTL